LFVICVFVILELKASGCKGFSRPCSWSFRGFQFSSR